VSHTVLYYLRARYYDPSTAQFLSRDPMAATTREPYAYVHDNPLNATDLSGRCDWLAWAIVGALCSAEQQLAEHPLSQPAPQWERDVVNGEANAWSTAHDDVIQTRHWLGTRNWGAFAIGTLEGLDAVVNTCIAAIGASFTSVTFGASFAFVTLPAGAAAALEYWQAGKEYGKWASGAK
jgi:uncharacterized protein RhaS with RHS repeats